VLQGKIPSEKGGGATGNSSCWAAERGRQKAMDMSDMKNNTLFMGWSNPSFCLLMFYPLNVGKPTPEDILEVPTGGKFSIN
jgi:hypothetical protein